MADEAQTDGAAVDALPYRPCVGVMLLNPAGLVFAGQRIDNPGPAWQMPQGGIDTGEDVVEAGLRELEEETGVGRDLVRVLAESEGWHRYDLPDELMGRIWGGRYRGQEQKWLALAFEGDDADVRLDAHEPEFSTWAWATPGFLIERIVPFKRDLYRAVFAEFAHLLR